MIWNKHSKLEGQHAFLSASKYHWINYDVGQLLNRYASAYIPAIGTALHELAKKLIDNKIKLSKSDKKMILFWLLDHHIPRNVIDLDSIYENFMAYVNDAIGFRMDTEVLLLYSEYAFGTADAISFRDGVLQIHDLKTGSTPAHMEQLLVYVAYFCLEYNKKPGDLQIELRIYQNGEIEEYRPTAEDIVPIMDTIITFDKVIRKEEGREG